MLLTLGVIIAIGMLAQWLSWKFKIPAVVSLIILGFLSGPVFGLLNPTTVMSNELMFTVIELCVALVLFDGAMQLRMREFKLVSHGLRRLLTLGVIFHFILISSSAYFIMGISPGLAALLGGILIVTGPTVILPALRETKVNKRVANFLKWEGILTDPLGAIVAVVVVDGIILSQTTDNGHIFSAIISIILVSIIFSFVVKKILDFTLDSNLLPEYLQIPFITSLVLCSFIFSHSLQHGSGLLTVTLLGFLVGNSKMDVLFNLRSFKENITTMCISFVFILIASSISLDVFYHIEFKHIGFILLVAFVLRTSAIFLATVNSHMHWREKFLIGYYGPRGIVAASVASALTVEMQQQNIKDAEIIVPLVFLIILTTVIIHGFSLNSIAKKLKLNANDRNGVVFIGTMPWVIDFAEKLHHLKIPVLVTSASWYKLAPARDRGIRTFYGQILDELPFDGVDLTDYSFFIGMSENDSFNLLACDRFGKYFGKENVYHLKRARNLPEDKYRVDGKDYSGASQDLDLRYENLMKYYQYGWKFKDTLLTAEYNFQDFLLDNEKAIICLLIKKKNQEILWGNDFGEYVPSDGDIIISFAPASVKKAPASA